MAIEMRAGNMPHVFWIDLKNDGVYVECVVMKRDRLGQIHYIDLRALDQIDKGRLARILSNRNSTHFELWDLMSNITLNNGVNALTYFHQLVHTLTPGGRIMRPQRGVVGTQGQIDTRGSESKKRMEEAAGIAAKAAAEAAASAAAKAIHDLQKPPTVLPDPNEGIPPREPARTTRTEKGRTSPSR